MIYWHTIQLYLVLYLGQVFSNQLFVCDPIQTQMTAQAKSLTPDSSSKSLRFHLINHLLS